MRGGGEASTGRERVSHDARLMRAELAFGSPVGSAQNLDPPVFARHDGTEGPGVELCDGHDPVELGLGQIVPGFGGDDMSLEGKKAVEKTKA